MNPSAIKPEIANKRIAIFLPSLERGGAERRMSLLAEQLKHRGYQIDVVLLRKKGHFVDWLETYDIPIRSIEKDGRFDLIGAAFRAMILFREQRYDVVLSCLPSANLFSVLVKLLNRDTRLIWGIAAADMPMQHYGLWARVGAILQKKLSSLSDLIVVNSFFAKHIFEQQGLQPDKMCVVQNGVDTEKFQYDAEVGKEWRLKFDIPLSAHVIGLVARLDPAKGVENFLEAVEIAIKKGQKNWYFVIVGSGESDYALRLKQDIEKSGSYPKQLRLLENTQVDNVIYNAMDMLSITSVSESFPNVMLEAMSCNTKLVSTDVGDCKQVINDYGKVIAIGDAQALYEAWETELMKTKNSTTSQQAQDKSMRDYVIENYSIDRMVEKFEQILCDQLHMQSFR